MKPISLNFCSCIFSTQLDLYDRSYIGFFLPVYSLFYWFFRGHKIILKTHLGFWMSSKSMYSEFFLCEGSSSFCSADGQVSVSRLGCEEIINFSKLGLKSPSSHIPESRTLFGSMLELFFEVAVLQSTEIAIYFSIVDWHHSQVETWLLEAREKLQFLPFRSFLT